MCWQSVDPGTLLPAVLMLVCLSGSSQMLFVFVKVAWSFAVFKVGGEGLAWLLVPQQGCRPHIQAAL